MSTSLRSQILSWLERLAAGQVTREEAARWAGQIVEDDAMPDEPDLFDAIDELAGADLPTTDREYLYGKEDFEAWLAKLKASA
jgi:hypothetical protein